MEQVASIRRYQLEDGKGRGMRCFEVTNGSGFDFAVYPDRGLDIGPARYNGKSLTWMTRNGPVNPAFYDKSSVEWLRTWMGGLVTTCGWMNVGNPCTTDNGDQGLHGRADHTPAEEVNTRCFWADDDDYVMEISGKIAHCRVFEIAKRYGALGWKVNGAGGDGGSATILSDGNESARRDMLAEIAALGGGIREIGIRLDYQGVRIVRG